MKLRIALGGFNNKHLNMKWCSNAGQGSALRIEKLYWKQNSCTVNYQDEDMRQAIEASQQASFVFSLSHWWSGWVIEVSLISALAADSRIYQMTLRCKNHQLLTGLGCTCWQWHMYSANNPLFTHRQQVALYMICGSTFSPTSYIWTQIQCEDCWVKCFKAEKAFKKLEVFAFWL